MSQVLQLSDDEYARLEQAARERGSTVAELVHAWIDSMSATLSETSIREAQARWSTLGASVAQPTDDELRAHPLLRASGILQSGRPGEIANHDQIIAEEALDSHANE
jgi:hypothetical protein